jgi:hypothetical protein
MVAAILATSPFLALGALACPLGMGAMMWFMARGGSSKAKSPNSQPATLEDLRREQQRLAVQIDDLEGDQSGERGVATATGADTERNAFGRGAGARDTLRT